MHITSASLNQKGATRARQLRGKKIEVAVPSWKLSGKGKKEVTKGIKLLRKTP